MPAGSKADLSLVKAETISDGGSASWITYLRRGKEKPRVTAIAAGEMCQNMWEKQLCRHQGQWKWEGGDAPGAGADILLQPMLSTMD